MKYFLFFDFDGVLCGWKDWIYRKKPETSTEIRRDKSLFRNHINYLDNRTLYAIDKCLDKVDGEVYFIPMSSWSSLFKSKHLLKFLLKKLNCTHLKIFEPQHYLNTNPPHPNEIKNAHDNRPLHILDFVNKYKPDDYIVFDDEYITGYMKYKMPYIHCHPLEGFTAKNRDTLYWYVEYYWNKEKSEMKEDTLSKSMFVQQNDIL